MRALKAFLLGALAVGALAYALVATLALTAQAAGRTLVVAVGPVLLVSVDAAGTSTETTFGLGMLAIPLAGGVANLAASRLVRGRADSRADRVD